MRKGYEVSATRPIVSDEEGYQVFHYYWNAYVYIFEGNLREAPRQILQQYLGIEELEAILEALLWIYQEERK